MAIKIGGVTVIDDQRNLVNINTGLGVGVKSTSETSSAIIGLGATMLNFIGAGNTFGFNAELNQMDIFIQGGISTNWIATCRGIANNSSIVDSLDMPSYYQEGMNVAMVGPIEVSIGATVTVGAGVTFVVV